MKKADIKIGEVYYVERAQYSSATGYARIIATGLTRSSGSSWHKSTTRDGVEVEIVEVISPGYQFEKGETILLRSRDIIEHESTHRPAAAESARKHAELQAERERVEAERRALNEPLRERVAKHLADVMGWDVSVKDRSHYDDAKDGVVHVSGKPTGTVLVEIELTNLAEILGVL